MFSSLLLIIVLLNPFRPCEGLPSCDGLSPCEGSPIYQEEYCRAKYIPKVIEAWHGLQIVAPDTPYVATAGRNSLHFIDTRFDVETAKHMKEQIEKATLPKKEEYIAIDEVSATAEVKNSITGETTFVFDPVYARILFAKGINKRNPEIKLPEHESVGDWLVTYDIDAIWTNTLPAAIKDEQVSLGIEEL